MRLNLSKEDVDHIKFVLNFHAEKCINHVNAVNTSLDLLKRLDKRKDGRRVVVHYLEQVVNSDPILGYSNDEMLAPCGCSQPVDPKKRWQFSKTGDFSANKDGVTCRKCRMILKLPLDAVTQPIKKTRNITLEL